MSLGGAYAKQGFYGPDRDVAPLAVLIQGWIICRQRQGRRHAQRLAKLHQIVRRYTTRNREFVRAPFGHVQHVEVDVNIERRFGCAMYGS